MTVIGKKGIESTSVFSAYGITDSEGNLRVVSNIKEARTIINFIKENGVSEVQFSADSFRKVAEWSFTHEKESLDNSSYVIFTFES